MRVSFVIPAYNEERVLPECLRSVFEEISRVRAAGTPVDTEVVVVNNASTDRTREEALKFAGVTVVEEPLKGLVYARRAGFVASSGELVANVDADAMLPAGWLSKVLAEFARDPRLVALSGPYIYHDLPLYARALTASFYFPGWGVNLLSQGLFRRPMMLQGGNFVLRRDAWERAGGFDTSISFYGEDSDVVRRIGRFGRVKWTWRLPMYSSGRRLKHEGIVSTGLKYALNFASIHTTGRPATAKYTDIRPD